MELWVLLVTSFLVGLTGALSPGPLLTVTVSESVRRGFWAGPLVVLGHCLLEIALIVALVMGLQELLKFNGVKGTIGILGGLFLLWLGYQMLRDAYRDSLDITLSGEGKSMKWGGPVLAGLLASLSNPYFVLWWATVGAAYVFVSLEYGWLGLVLFTAGHISSDLLWYSLVSFAVARGRRYIGHNFYRGLLGACGVFLVGLALYFCVSGWNYMGLFAG